MKNKMHITTDVERRKLYESSRHQEAPRSCDPNKHTMGPTAFKKYIGRENSDHFSLTAKKFSPRQNELLRTAYKNSWRIRVIGAYRDDLAFLLSRENFRIISQPEFHEKGKQFNSLRQVFAHVEKISPDPSRDQELWILCFPSRQYVNQVAELVSAIVNDFSEQTRLETSKDMILAEHYPGLESTISIWTNLEDFASLHVRHGDVVCIGNVDLVIDGIRQYSFSPTHPEFQFGGLGDIYGAQTFVNNHSASRIVLVGFKESFWGDASAQLASGLLGVGASHILYASKAASIVDRKDVHRIYAPQQFMLLLDDGKSRKFDIQKGYIGDFIENLNIDHAGLSVTVPTVIGESLEQRESIQRQGATCMDCENGHIAGALEKHNKIFCSDDSRLRSNGFASHFLPLHFITDYIYAKDEHQSGSKGDLSIHAEDNPDYRRLRGESFKRIGNVFASYALMLGMKDATTSVKDVSTDTHTSEESFEDAFSGIRTLLDAGLGKEALTQLSSRSSDRHPLVQAIVQVMICQKHGYISAAYRGLQKLRESASWGSIPLEARIRLGVIALKLYSQVGSSSRMNAEISYLFHEENIDTLREIHQFGAAKRRQAIYFSLCGDFDSAKKCIDEANDSGKNGNDHYSATNSLFLEITRLPLAKDRRLSEVSSSLSSIRDMYLAGTRKATWWQTNFEKCANAALFLEAAYHLSAHQFNRSALEEGVRKLTIAHLRNMRLGGNERSEAYGEIVKCTKDVNVRNILCLAMRDDLRAHEKYQQWLHRNFDSLAQQIQLSSTLN